MDQSIIFDLELIKRHDKAGPRYTSYPTAVQFNEQFTAKQYVQHCEKTNAISQAENVPTPLSLYFHIPFCDTVCFYCGCNKVVTKDRSKARPYLDRMHKEITMHSKLIDDNRVVKQLHWGGGTPTFIKHNEMRELMAVTRQHFNLANDSIGEYSIEIDPREVSAKTIAVLREIGFNRLSLGVQDVDPNVQKAVNRIQPNEVTLAAINNARQQGFKSISIDLIYGLPLQTAESFNNTIDWVIDTAPDRLSVFNYAHLPEMFKPQRRINKADLPSAQEKLLILQQTIEKLRTAGYVYIGMDHFAKPDDELAIAQRQGTLYRNFQGYSTHSDCDLVAMGITSIGQIGDTYSQNVKDLASYYELIDADKLPVYRGVELNNDDVLRRAVITQLICHFGLEKSTIETQFNIKFDDYFNTELEELSRMEQEGLVSVSDKNVSVMPGGRLLIRNICMVFDRYLRNATEQRYSKVI